MTGLTSPTGAMTTFRQIHQAINEWEYFSLLRFVSYDAAIHGPHITFYVSASGGCSSPIGRQTTENGINLYEARCPTATIAHEIAHSLGFYHEQVR